MPDAVFDLPVKESYWLVQIQYGDQNFPQFIRLTDATDDFVLLASGLYKSTTLMSINTQANTGVFERKSWEIEIPVNDNTVLFLDALGNGRAHSPLTLTAWEYAIDAVSGDVQTLKHVEGKCGSLTRNPEGRSGMARFSVLTLKTNIERPLGVPSLDHCQATFGDHWCGFTTLNSLKETGQLTAIDGLLATIENLSPQRIRYWHRGYVEKDGVRINIKEWVSGDSFVLSRFIPLVWEESLLVTPFEVDLVVTPGCDKRISTCDEWGRVEEGFSGWGIAIPKYNPTMGSE